MHLPWVKNQDFYLRLGFLKALVVALSPQRRSAHNDVVVQRLSTPLLNTAHSHDLLWRRAQSKVPWYANEHEAGRFEKPSVAEALLAVDGCPSMLFGITAPTAYKILDWGHDVGLVGRANQITERGLLLRHLIDFQAAEQFLSGAIEAWNPFVLTRRERLFFLFHLFDVDRVTLEIVQALADLPVGSVLGPAEAGKMTCGALVKTLELAKRDLPPRDIPAYRTALELAGTISRELGLEHPSALGEARTRRLPRPLKPSQRASAFLGTSQKKHRVTTKSADHQTISRFEQLVDLGFLAKPDHDGSRGTDDGRRRWRYVTTDVCSRWGKREIAADHRRLLVDGFAKAACAAFATAADRRRDDVLTARYLLRAYEMVHRPVGHTPLDSTALLGMILAVDDGLALELADFHRLMIQVKEGNQMADLVFFASGNDLDKMFILLKPGFVERMREIKCAKAGGDEHVHRDE